VRRLYSTFAASWPGVGLLLMRLVVGAVVLVRGGAQLWSHPALPAAVTSASLTGSGSLLIAGLWTPLAGAAVAVIEISQMVAMDEEPLVCLLAATSAVALAMLGPGRWSLDARLFGWKRIDATPRRRSPNAL
jgi:uncharacterized membrane protein YphA (DoxX/SURF4 family)